MHKINFHGGYVLPGTLAKRPKSNYRLIITDFRKSNAQNKVKFAWWLHNNACNVYVKFHFNHVKFHADFCTFLLGWSHLSTPAGGGTMSLYDLYWFIYELYNI